MQAWLVCPDAQGNADVYVNLGIFAYHTPAIYADEMIHVCMGVAAAA
jgi:hypothetical protein